MTRKPKRLKVSVRRRRERVRPGSSAPVSIPLGGPEGKPFFVAGPYDDITIIISKLTRAVGPDGFHYVVPIDPETEFLEDGS
jgi:hypothetical protein